MNPGLGLTHTTEIPGSMAPERDAEPTFCCPPDGASAPIDTHPPARLDSNHDTDSVDSAEWDRTVTALRDADAADPSTTKSRRLLPANQRRSGM